MYSIVVRQLCPLQSVSPHISSIQLAPYIAITLLTRRKLTVLYFNKWGFQKVNQIINSCKWKSLFFAYVLIISCPQICQMLFVSKKVNIILKIFSFPQRCTHILLILIGSKEMIRTEFPTTEDGSGLLGRRM